MCNRERHLFWIAAALVIANPASGAQKSGWTQPAAVIEREPGVEELAAYPPDGRTLQVNPPGFTWTPNEKAKAYRLEVRRASERSQSVVSSESLSSTVCALPSRPDNPNPGP